MDPILPTFLIVGAAKSGTSSLWHYLREHPDVYVPAGKEINFFSDEANFSRGLDWYTSHFKSGAGKKAIGEASPSYLFPVEAAPRMASVVPKARLVAILRNPVDRAYSHFLHARYYAMERRSFRQAFEDERQATDGRRWPFYLAFSRYLSQLVNLTQHFRREQLKVLLFDDLAANPLETFRTLCFHIDVDPTIIPSNVGQITNTYRESRATPLLRLLIRPALGGKIPLKIWLPILRLFTREGLSPPPIEPDLRHDLVEYFAEDNAKLGAWLDKDLSIWNK